MSIVEKKSIEAGKTKKETDLSIEEASSRILMIMKGTESVNSTVRNYMAKTRAKAEKTATKEGKSEKDVKLAGEMAVEEEIRGIRVFAATQLAKGKAILDGKSEADVELAGEMAEAGERRRIKEEGRRNRVSAASQLVMEKATREGKSEEKVNLSGAMAEEEEEMRIKAEEERKNREEKNKAAED